MVIYHIRDLMLRKSVKTNKKITYDTITEETGISKMTLSRMSSQRGYNATVENIERLCNYFQCTPNDLISIIPDPPESRPPDARE
jgi:putative transcriptional regulator